MRAPAVRSRAPSTATLPLSGQTTADMSNAAVFSLGDTGLTHANNYDRVGASEAHQQNSIMDGSTSLRRQGTAAGFVESARGYLSDWCCLAAVLLVLLLVRSTVPPHQQYIQQVGWPQYMYPRHPNTVPSWTVPVISLIVPPCIFVGAYRFRRSGQELHMMLLGGTSSVLYCGLITDVVKRMVGRPRPDFFVSPACSLLPGHPLTTTPVPGFPQCTGVYSEIIEGMQSFPSGHTSWCTAGLAFVTFWLLAITTTSDPRQSLLPSTAWRFWVSMLPLSCAALIGITRFMDYWHHWTDVASGFVLGMSLAWLNFKLYGGCIRVNQYEPDGMRRDKGKEPAPADILDDGTPSYGAV